MEILREITSWCKGMTVARWLRAMAVCVLLCTAPEGVTILPTLVWAGLLVVAGWSVWKFDREFYRQKVDDWEL